MQNKVVKVTKTRFFCFFQPESSSLCCTQFWETKIKQLISPPIKVVHIPLTTERQLSPLHLFCILRHPLMCCVCRKRRDTCDSSQTFLQKTVRSKKQKRMNHSFSLNPDDFLCFTFYCQTTDWQDKESRKEREGGEERKSLKISWRFESNTKLLEDGLDKSCIPFPVTSASLFGYIFQERGTEKNCHKNLSSHLSVYLVYHKETSSHPSFPSFLVPVTAFCCYGLFCAQFLSFSS